MTNGIRKNQTPHEGKIHNQEPNADLKEKVLKYFRNNSQAMDSVDGIARFWVQEDRSLVERCLSDLHTQGLLEGKYVAGTLFYCLPHSSSQPGSPRGKPHTIPKALETEVFGKILVVEDDTSVRKFLVDALTGAGHSVAAVENGEYAIKKIGSETFDLVVTDVVMPGISGLEVLKTVKRNRSGTEVIVISAHATVDIAIQALRRGAYDFLTKPLDDLECLYRAVERALEKKRLEADNRLLVNHLEERNVELKNTVSRLSALNEIGQTVTGLFDLDELFESLARIVAQHLQASRVSVLVSEPDGKTMQLVAAVGITKREAFESQVKVGEGIAGRVASSQEPLLVQDIEKTEFKSQGNGTNYKTPSFMIAPMMVNYPIRYQRKRVGVINVSDKRSGEPFDDQDLEFLSTLSSQVAIAIEHAQLIHEMEDGYLAALVTLIQAAENSHPASSGHSRRVMEMAGSVGQLMGLSRARIRLLVRAAALHEVGRLSVSSGEGENGNGARKVCEEWDLDAVVAAESILAPINTLQRVRDILLHSASSFDATKFILGVSRSAHPLESRILATCDEFVRLTAGREQEPGKSLRALEAIRIQIGRNHDPEVVTALYQVVESNPPDQGGVE